MKVALYWSHSFLPECIRQDGLVFDFGMNDGGFAKLVSQRCSRVIGFEPDPRWASLKLPGNVIFVPKALAAHKGTRVFHVNEALCASMHYADVAAKQIEVETVTFEEALTLAPAGRIDLVKMDIEGEEVAVLERAPEAALRRVAQMTVEFHDFLDATSRPAIEQVLKRLGRLNFEVVCFSLKTYGDVLCLNRDYVRLSPWQRMWLRFRFKYGRGVGRMLRRSVGR
jgi:FkbM family methyltransferase